MSDNSSIKFPQKSRFICPVNSNILETMKKVNICIFSWKINKTIIIKLT